MTWRRTGILLLATALLLANPAPGQEETCTGATSVGECFEAGYQLEKQRSSPAVLKQMAEDKASEVNAKAEKKVRTAETNTVADASTQGASLTNFLAPFLALVDSGQLGSEGQKLGIELAAKLLDDLDKDTKFQVVFNEPELFGPLKTRFVSDMMSERAEALEKSLDDTDDLTLKVSWTPVSDYWGRSIEHHRDTISTLFDEAANAAAEEADLVAKNRALTDLLTRYHQQCPDPADPSQILFSCLTDADKQQVFEAGRNLGRFNEALRQKIEDTHLVQIGKLLNNQPQLVVSATFTARDELAGPDETSVSVQYEKGTVSINTMENDCEDESDLLSCYSRYLGKKERQDSLGANNRLAFKLEYSEIGDVALTIPGDAAMMTEDFTFAQPGGSSLMASLTYGRYLWINPNNDQSARIDFSAMGELVDNDPMPDSMMAMMGEAMMRQERVLASLTYTQRLNDQTAAVIGLTWASEPEFLGDVTQKLGARAGLTYKITGQKDDGG